MLRTALNSYGVENVDTLSVKSDPIRDSASLSASVVLLTNAMRLGLESTSGDGAALCAVDTAKASYEGTA